MAANYRKSAGRFGEIGNESGVQRPPMRPTIAFPNARIVLDRPTVSPTVHSVDDTSSILAQEFYLSSVETDDMSSLGDETSFLGVILPATIPFHRIAGPNATTAFDKEVSTTDTNTTSQTMESSMTTLMDLFSPVETSTEVLQPPPGDIIEDDERDIVVTDPKPTSEVPKKKTKKKRPEEKTSKTLDLESDQKTKDGKLKKKRKKPKVDEKGGASRTKDKLERTKKKLAVKEIVPESDPSSSSGVSSKEPEKRTKKKSRKTQASTTDVKKDGSKQKEQTESCNQEGVVTYSGKEKSKGEGSKPKGKVGSRKKKHPTEISDFSPIERAGGQNDIMYIPEEVASRPLGADETSHYPTVASTHDESLLRLASEHFDDHFFEDSSSLSGKNSTHPTQTVVLPGLKRRMGMTRKGQQSGEAPPRTLELAIASKPKIRPRVKDEQIPKKAQTRFLQKLVWGM